MSGLAWVNDKEAQLSSALLQGDLLELVIKKNINSRPISFIMRCQAKQLLAVEGDQQATPAEKVVDKL